jgi:allantoin racemase
VPGVLAEILKAKNVEAFVIACFDDTGLEAARCATECPVLGIGEAAFHMASLLAGKFGVVTTLARSIPAIEHNLSKYGLAARCAAVRACDVPVLELETANARQKISNQINGMLQQDHAEAIVLGCAGMADLAAALSREHSVPVLDGVSCAVKLCEGLVGLGLRTAKSGGYQSPRANCIQEYFLPIRPLAEGVHDRATFRNCRTRLKELAAPRAAHACDRRSAGSGERTPSFYAPPLIKTCLTKLRWGQWNVLLIGRECPACCIEPVIGNFYGRYCNGPSSSSQLVRKPSAALILRNE